MTDRPALEAALRIWHNHARVPRKGERLNREAGEIFVYVNPSELIEAIAQAIEDGQKGIIPRPVIHL